MADSLSRLLPSLLGEFSRQFGPPGEEAIVSWAPGRVNLIGEHTDYNDGFVLPMAIDRGLAVLLEPTGDRELTLFSPAYRELASFSLDRITRQPAGWINYPAGVARELEARGLALRGGRGVIAGDVPIGSGLSSSAAVEVASALAFLSLLEPEERRDLTGPELARLCQRAENDFVGLDCGIMDQFTSVLARAGRALFLDCRNLEFHHLLLDTAAYGFIVADSGKSRELASSAYNERRRQCQQAVAILAAGRPEIHSLRDVPPQELARRQQELPPVIHRRARHVVEEIARTLQAREALERGDYAEFGRLMNQSHESLRDLYEVSSAELDRLVEIARSCRGVLGSRLTGAGFGGCTVTLAEAGAAAEVMGELRRSCQRDAGLPPALFFTTPVAGARASRLAEVAG